MSQVDKQMVIDDKTKQSTQEVLFDFIAKSVSDFMKEQTITSKLPLGFTFSFPVHQTSLIAGTLIRWTKDFSASGAEGENVVRLLKEAFDRQGVRREICLLRIHVHGVVQYGYCPGHQ